VVLDWNKGGERLLMKRFVGGVVYMEGRIGRSLYDMVSVCMEKRMDHEHLGEKQMDLGAYMINEDN
jgi:hypothetical protein